MGIADHGRGFPGWDECGQGVEYCRKTRFFCACHCGAGADVIKTFYLDNTGDFSGVVQNALVPLVVLGGVKSDDPNFVGTNCFVPDKGHPEWLSKEYLGAYNSGAMTRL